MDHRCAGVVARDPERAVALGSGQRVVAAVQPGRQVRQRRYADGLAGPVLGAPDRQAGEGLVDLLEHRLLRVDPARAPGVAVAGREHPVGNNAVDAVAEERQAGVGAPRLGEHDVLRGEHQPDRGVGAGEQLVHLVELGVQPGDGVEDRVARHRHPGRAIEHRSQRLHQSALDRQQALHVPAQRLGQREQPQGLGRGRAVDDDHVPAARAGVQAQLEQSEHLLGAGDHRHLLGGDRIHPGGIENRQQVALDVGPGLLEPQLGVDLMDEQPVGDLGRLCVHPTRGAVGVGQRVRRVGGQDERPEPAGGGERGRAGGDGRLADTALAGEEDDAHARAPLPGDQAPDSTRFLRPFNAVSIRIFSPLRFSMPISGMETSRASR